MGRWGWRAGALGATATVLAVLSASAPSAARAAAPGDALGAGALFHVETTAAGLTLTSTQKPAMSIITAGLVDGTAAYAAGTLDASGGSRARAAAYFPGDLVVQGPSLLCELAGGCPTDPPAYPLLADASYPTHPQDRVAPVDQQGGQAPVSLVAGEADATAEERSAAASAQAGSVRALPGSPATVGVGSSSARTTTSVRGDGVHVTVESVLHDVTVGGLLHVQTVHAIDEIVARPGGTPTDRPAVTLVGVTFAGRAATVDDRGVHVAGHDGPSPAQQLARQGVTVALLGGDRQDSAGAARSTARGLLVTFALPVSGVPYVPNPVPCPDGFPFCVGGANVDTTYVGTITLGSVGAAVDVEPPLGLGGSGLRPNPPTAPAATGAGTGATAPAPGAETGRRAGGPGLAPVVAQGGRPGLPGLLAGLSRLRLDALYAVLALLTITLFVGWRATMTLVAGRRR